MITKEHRFHGDKAIRHVLARGTSVRGESLSVKFVKKDQALPYRLAIVVSTKVHKSAVVRNRIRRRLYEVVRESSENFNGSYDIVIIVYNESLKTMPYDKLKKMLNATLSKTKATD